jgi:hypothetical protein
MSETHKRRGGRPVGCGRPWSAEEHRLVNVLPAQEFVGRFGRTLSAVYSRRSLLRQVCEA